ncbi:MAG TPA: hypothetical protein DDZ80_00660 [Cyanobacteria bacterium UBA8803]|nr:hypothetical protein [Cyanobacteria bacterium UBA9273]HBL57122.1 hypothetical protein [Cyanobacteria bacterium UBA8803]
MVGFLPMRLSVSELVKWGSALEEQQFTGLEPSGLPTLHQFGCSFFVHLNPVTYLYKILLIYATHWGYE